MPVAERLRRTRESRGLTLERLSHLTKIPVRTLAALERSEFDRLPGGLFTRGFLRAYAREVGLDPDEVVLEYLDEAPSPPAIQPVTPVTSAHPFETEDRLGGLSPSGVLVAFVVLTGLIYFVRTPEPPAPQSPPKAEVASQMGTESPRAIPTAGGNQAGVRIEIVPTGPCWAEARADGRRVLYKLMSAGERASLRAERSLTLRLGDAGACAISRDGGPAQPPGPPGKIRTLTVSSPTATVATAAAFAGR